MYYDNFYILKISIRISCIKELQTKSHPAVSPFMLYAAVWPAERHAQRQQSDVMWVSAINESPTFHTIHTSFSVFLFFVLFTLVETDKNRLMLPRIIHNAPLFLKDSSIKTKQNKTKTKYDNFFMILYILLFPLNHFPKCFHFWQPNKTFYLTMHRFLSFYHFISTNSLSLFS